MSEHTVYITKERIQELTKERENLMNVKIPEIANRINNAKELGDLSENFEYHEAKEHIAFAHRRLREIDDILNRAIVYSADDKSDSVGLGSKITVLKDDVQKEYIVVGAQEANPLEGKISNESPFGSAFIGKRVGDIAVVVTPKGDVEYKIVKIE